MLYNTQDIANLIMVVEMKETVVKKPSKLRENKHNYVVYKLLSVHSADSQFRQFQFMNRLLGKKLKFL